MSSILGGIKDRVLGQDEGSKQKQFDDLRKMLTSSKGIALTDIRDMLKEQTGSWQAMIPGTPGVAALKKYIEIVDKMTPKQRKNPASIPPSGKIKLAKDAETDQKHVDSLITMYSQINISSVWLRYKLYKNEELPKNQAEMAEMQQYDKRLQYIAGELVGSKNLPYKGKKYTNFLSQGPKQIFR
jgi:signal recognition particle GTPase